MSKTVECNLHGAQAPAYVCQHLVKSLQDRKSRGLVWSRDEDNCYNAYCDECDEMLEVDGGVWTQALEEKADIKLICEACMDVLFQVNKQAGGGI